jgi:hypothetical protein
MRCLLNALLVIPIPALLHVHKVPLVRIIGRSWRFEAISGPTVVIQLSLI